MTASSPPPRSAGEKCCEKSRPTTGRRSAGPPPSTHQRSTRTSSASCADEASDCATSLFERASVIEAARLDLEGQPFNWHIHLVLVAGEMRKPVRVPDHDVLAVDVTGTGNHLGDVVRRSGARAGNQRRVIVRRQQMARIVTRHPQLAQRPWLGGVVHPISKTSGRGDELIADVATTRVVDHLVVNPPGGEVSRADKVDRLVQQLILHCDKTLAVRRAGAGGRWVERRLQRNVV